MGKTYFGNLGCKWSVHQCRGTGQCADGNDRKYEPGDILLINSGSGNQGITASVPVIVYARELGVSEDKMYRALALSDLTTIHQKTPIGRLSAFCGAVSAGAGECYSVMSNSL